jgi:hypothetical protein
MSAEDDIFLAEESPIAHHRKLSYVYYKNKIRITMSDLSKGGGGSPEKRPYDVSQGQDRYIEASLRINALSRRRAFRSNVEVLLVFFSLILSIRSFVVLLSQTRLAQTVRVYIEFIFHTIVPVHRCFCTTVFLIIRVVKSSIP